MKTVAVQAGEAIGRQAGAVLHSQVCPCWTAKAPIAKCECWILRDAMDLAEMLGRMGLLRADE